MDVTGHDPVWALSRVCQQIRIEVISVYLYNAELHLDSGAIVDGGADFLNCIQSRLDVWRGIKHLSLGLLLRKGARYDALIKISNFLTTNLSLIIFDLDLGCDSMAIMELMAIGQGEIGPMPFES